MLKLIYLHHTVSSITDTVVAASSGTCLRSIEDEKTNALHIPGSEDVSKDIVSLHHAGDPPIWPHPQVQDVLSRLLVGMHPVLLHE